MADGTLTDREREAFAALARQIESRPVRLVTWLRVVCGAPRSRRTVGVTLIVAGLVTMIAALAVDLIALAFVSYTALLIGTREACRGVALAALVRRAMHRVRRHRSG